MKLEDMMMAQMMMYKVTYLNKGSNEWQTALFTDNMEAQTFEAFLEKTGECELIARNRWSWKVEIED